MPDMAVTAGDLGLMRHSCLSNIINFLDMTLTTKRTIRLLLRFSGTVRPPEWKWDGAEQDNCKNQFADINAQTVSIIKNNYQFFLTGKS